MSDDLIARARAALEGTTDGPWWTDGVYNGADRACAIIAARTDSGPLPGNPTRGLVAVSTASLNCFAPVAKANARFIAAVRDLVPAMADRIEALEAENARLREYFDAVEAFDGSGLTDEKSSRVKAARAAIKGGAT